MALTDEEEMRINAILGKQAILKNDIETINKLKSLNPDNVTDIGTRKTPDNQTVIYWVSNGETLEALLMTKRVLVGIVGCVVQIMEESNSALSHEIDTDKQKINTSE